MNFIQLHTIQVPNPDGTLIQSKELFIAAHHIIAFEQVKINTGGTHTAVRLMDNMIVNVVENPQQIGQLLFPDDDVVFQEVDINAGNKDKIEPPTESTVQPKTHAKKK